MENIKKWTLAEWAIFAQGVMVGTWLSLICVTVRKYISE